MNLNSIRNRTPVAGLLLGLASASPAFSATITIGGTPTADGGETTSLIGASVVTFDGGTAPSNYFLSGDAQIVTGSILDIYSAPTNDSTAYLTMGIGQVTIDYSSHPIDYFGLYWGSADAYNTLVFTNTQGQQDNYSGTQLESLGVLVNGSQSNYVNFFADPGQDWTSVSLVSTTYAFEVDNIAATADLNAVPEPAGIGMACLGLGLTCLGAVRRRASRSPNA